MDIYNFFKSFNNPQEFIYFYELNKKKQEIIRRNTPGTIECKLKKAHLLKSDLGEYILEKKEK